MYIYILLYIHVIIIIIYIYIIIIIVYYYILNKLLCLVRILKIHNNMNQNNTKDDSTIFHVGAMSIFSDNVSEIFSLADRFTKENVDDHFQYKERGTETIL